MSDLPLSTLLSQVLVAYTIEFDNEFEARMPHRTSRGPAGHGPWLVSMAMWSNFLRYLDADGDLFLVDRLRELIIVSGFNVFPSEVEQVLWSHPAVLALLAVGWLGWLGFLIWAKRFFTAENRA